MATITEANLVAHLQDFGITDASSSPFGLKVVGFETADTVDGGDVLQVTLATYGITNLEDVWLFTHTTKDDVIVTSATEFTSAVSSGTCNVTIPAGEANSKRVMLLWGR